MGENATYRSVQERNIGFVFQHYALFKHLTVRENVAFAMDLRKHPKNRVTQRVDELLELVQMQGFGDGFANTFVNAILLNYLVDKDNGSH